MTGPPTPKLLIATSNAGKLKEFRGMLPRGLDVIGVADTDIAMPDETGSTFREIADRKARYAAHMSGLLALGDDSGLEVEALNGAPGILSARFAGEPSDDARNRGLLLHRMQSVSCPERAARFVCAVTIASPNGFIWTSEGVWRGTIVDRERGWRGFGYDSLFMLPDGRTVAELLDEEKNEMSHRAEAMAKLLPVLLIAFGMSGHADRALT